MQKETQIDPKRGRRALTRKVFIYDREHLKANTVFETHDGSRYAVHPSGAFVRTDKDRRSVKERKAARRAMRGN